MHSIELINIQFKNLFSYGSNINEVKLNNDGITWIKGPNGSGKSTIIEAITVALFGESYRKIPQKEMINAANQSKLWVRLEFYRRDSKAETHYVVERSLGRSGSMSFDIWVNGQHKEKEAGYSQKYFEDEIIGFNRNLFENVISLNTIQSKPFIDMDSKEKRTLLESIIALHIDKIKKLNADEFSITSARYSDAENDVIKYQRRLSDLVIAKDALLREQQDDIDVLQQDIDTNKNTIARLEIDLKKIVEEEKQIIANGTQLKAKLDLFTSVDGDFRKLDEIKQLITHIDDSKPMLIDMESALAVQLNQLTPSLVELELFQVKYDTLLMEYKSKYNVSSLVELKQRERQLSNEIVTIEANIVNAQHELNHIKSENDSLKSGVACSTCGKLSTEDDMELIRENLRVAWTKSNSLKKDLNKKLKEIKSTHEKLPGIISSLDEENSLFLTRKTTVMAQQKSYDREYDTYKKLHAAHMANTDKLSTLIKYFSNEDIDIVEKRLNSAKSDRDSIVSEMNSLRTSLGIVKNNITTLSNTKYTVEKSIKVLEDRLNKRKNASEGGSLSLNESQIEATTIELNTARINVKKYSEELEIIKYISKMYGDDGIKKFVLGIFVPNLNQVISHNIALFALPFAIEFDDSLDYKFISKFGMAQVYKGLSQGQQRKLNFSISMAFRDFVSLIADFKINLMFLDEVLDVSTDDEGLRDMISLIKQKSSDIDSIYLMSHRGEDFEDEWNHIMEVSNDGMYSRVELLH